MLNKINDYKDSKKVLIILPGNIITRHKKNKTSENIQWLSFEQKIEAVEEEISILTKSPQKFKKNNNIDIISNITTREKEILRLIKMGKKTKEIAEELFLSIKTVENHRNNILKKTNSKNMLLLINELCKLRIFEL